MTGPWPLFQADILTEQDVFKVRQLGRELAAAVGLDGQDQVRVATALSEVGRQLLSLVGRTEITFGLVAANPAAIVVTAVAPGVPADPETFRREIDPARRLVDQWSAELRPDAVVVSMGRRLPRAAGTFPPERLAAIRASMAELAPSTPLQELAVQNRNLLATLEEIQAQRDGLLRLNAELEETNRGVMALYTQLSDELEATNRGVVALYAELDEKSAQLRDANEAKSRFLANVSHELRAPATAIIGLLRLLLDPRSEPVTSEQRHQLELVRGSAEDLLSLVNDLLDLAKAESGRLDPHWAEVNLTTVFGTLRGTLQSLVTKPDLELVVVDPVELPVLVSDDVLLTQILRNLLTNGIKYTERGEVRLTASYVPGADRVDLVVADTGPGIAVDEQERVFEEFYQARGTARVGVKGTGLGLPYARRLAMLLGGSLTLSSVVGQGSTFTVSLPVTGPAADADDHLPALVLVVEDDPAFRAAVTAVLTSSGTQVVEATSGREALEAIAAERPDLIMLDLRLPELDGRAVLDHLAGDPSTACIPVIVLTAFTEEAQGSPLPRAAAVLGKADTALGELPRLVRSVVGRSSQ